MTTKGHLVTVTRTTLKRKNWCIQLFIRFLVYFFVTVRPNNVTVPSDHRLLIQTVLHRTMWIYLLEAITNEKRSEKYSDVDWMFIKQMTTNGHKDDKKTKETTYSKSFVVVASP